jgi:hypothetical protein
MAKGATLRFPSTIAMVDPSIQPETYRSGTGVSLALKGEAANGGATDVEG